MPGRPADARAFTMPKDYDTAEMLRADLAAADIAATNDDGTVDYHALRHAFIGGLARAGVPVKTAMTLARHSDPALTLGCYSHALLTDLTTALDVLPDLSDGQANCGPLRGTGPVGGPLSREAATDIDDANIDNRDKQIFRVKNRAQFRAHQGDNPCYSLALSDIESNKYAMSKTHEKSVTDVDFGTIPPADTAW